MVTTISSKGQLVIPREIRGALHLEPGDRLNIRLEGTRIVLEPEKKNPVEELQGRYSGLDLITLQEEEHRRDAARGR